MQYEGQMWKQRTLEHEPITRWSYCVRWGLEYSLLTRDDTHTFTVNL
jgi:hypothetical protein